MSLGKLAVSLYRSSLDISKDASWLEEEDFRARLNICEKCDLYNHHAKRCKECGCYMMAKARFAGSKCPIGKW